MAKGVKIKKRTIRRNLRTLRRSGKKLAKDPLTNQANQVIGLSAGFTPIDTGNLITSRFVNRPIPTSRGMKIILGYTASHAPIVHERTEVGHQVGESKFLDKALRLSRSPYLRGLGSDVSSKLRALKFKL